ncbi:MAG: sugar phosphate nucleotidyltransferase [Solirubrobacteraceae bacterium]
MQALILAGGEGTRLRPLTSDTPKPVVPLVGRPFISYMLEWLRGHDVDEVIMSCGFLAEAIRSVLGDGSRFGVKLRYVEELRPLGTGGAAKYAQDLLDERFFMLNGDVLTDIDLTDQLRQHEQTKARATLALVSVEDPSAYGLVRCNGDKSVKEFLEKPSQEHGIATNHVSAGAYVLERDILAEMAPAGNNISIERDVFPKLVGRGLYGYEAVGYWLDIGTPARYMQATRDVLEGNVATTLGDELRRHGMRLLPSSGVRGRIAAPVVVGEDCEIAASAVIGGLVVLGRGVKVGSGARIEGSVLLDGASIGARTNVTDAIIGGDARIGERCQIVGGAMVGSRARIGNENVLAAGVRIFPEVSLPDGGIRF